MGEFEENVAKNLVNELFVVDYFNIHEGGGFEKAPGQERRWDVTGSKTIEVKSFLAGKYPTMPRKNFISCQSDYIAFPEVDEDRKPLGNIIIVDWPKLKELIRERTKNGWFKLPNGREIFSISRSELEDLPFSTVVSADTKRTIEELLSQKAIDFLS